MAGDRDEAGRVSWQLRLLNRLLRRVVRPRLQATETPTVAAAEFAGFARRCLRRPPYLLRLRSPGAPDIHWITAGPVARRGVTLYFHGGAYIAGSPRTHQGMLGRISALSRLRVAAPAYRLAPAHPAPAQFEDALAAHAALLDLGYRPGEILLGGDSAGGGLALALLADLCARDLRPAGLFAFSPWVDLTLQSESLVTNAGRDPFLSADRVPEVVDYATGGFDASDWRISPIFATFDAPPPVRLHVGTTEILRDDALRMKAHLRRCGADVSLRQWPQTPHIWPIYDGYLPEAREALRDVAGFARERLDDALRP
ncbi:alpha/beta hydrolase fold domain-containing protein [Tropicimonas sp. TH_r6]|uniref:alpha/beta hydrolase fold domain-containing protein n=1 Tax=Tropicimonas sp. TH_r6 TaxID=3082085 RepID=UPI002955CABA|nr:alpha/beta hydrolase fold domain-containing protein [Tropicimonas sp. TH_r6]MDV7142215.1 alpha/beta hydrolase fold domain-containing protein [Tropicimonas sp. TH_r6]